MGSLASLMVSVVAQAHSFASIPTIPEIASDTSVTSVVQTASAASRFSGSVADDVGTGILTATRKSETVTAASSSMLPSGPAESAFIFAEQGSRSKENGPMLALILMVGVAVTLVRV